MVIALTYKKKDLSPKAKLSTYRSTYLPTLTYWHEIWISTKRTKSWIQEAELSFLRKLALEFGDFLEVIVGGDPGVDVKHTKGTVHPFLHGNIF